MNAKKARKLKVPKKAKATRAAARKGGPKVTVSKGPMLARMDKLARKRKIMKAALNAIESQPEARLVDLGLLYGYVDKEAGEANHLRRHWFKSKAGIEKCLRQAFIKAARLSLAHNLPVDCYWVAGTARYAAAVCRSAQQITLLIFSPRGRMAKAIQAEDDITVFS